MLIQLILVLLFFSVSSHPTDERREILEARWRRQAATLMQDNVVRSINYTTKIEPSTSFGTWEGWGTSLAWRAAAFGNRTDIADAMFTMNDSVNVTVHPHGSASVPGLGLSIARYNVGASSIVPAGGEHMVVSPNMIPERAIKAVFLTWEHNNTYDWARDTNQRAMLSKARAISMQATTM